MVQLADHLQQVVGRSCHVPLTVHPRFLEGRLFHNPRSRDRAQLSRSSEAKVPSAMVRRRKRSRWYSEVRFLSLARR